jgi:segregation and condensation protein B
MNEEIQNQEIIEEESAVETVAELSTEESVTEESSVADEAAEENEFPTELDLTEEEIAAEEEPTESDAVSSDASEAEEAADIPDAAEDQITATREELKPVIEALMFVADEPLPFKQLCKILGEVPEADVQAALDELVADYEARNSGLDIREIAGGWRISTRPQHHEFIRKYLKSRPTARLSLPALETLAVIAYKQPITIPEILEIRGVSSSSAIKTLLEKRLIVTKGRKDTVGKPMLYGTSKEFLIQFGLKDLNELPSFEDFEDLAQ